MQGEEPDPKVQVSMSRNLTQYPRSRKADPTELKSSSSPLKTATVTS